MGILKYPVGIETFEDIINNGYVYVDKTGYIHHLVEEGKYYFLSRPRRFGKSLLLSTLSAFFEGKRHLFEGLEISRYNHDWTVSPVFHLNFVNFDTSSTDGLQSTLNAQISAWEDIYGKNSDEVDFAQRFFGVIRRAYEQTGRQVAILVDEYDKPLVASIDDDLLHDRFREMLKPIYATLKAADRYIRFAILTGVTRFSRLSIFSDINNLKDISLSDKYSGICGISEAELATYLKPGILQLAHKQEISYDQAFEELKSNYDGYHFSPMSQDIYNPFSVLCALDNLEIGAYWFITGTPTFLIKWIRNADYYLPDLLNDEADSIELSTMDSYHDSITSLLFQTGYLTIKGYDRKERLFRLGIPNREVAEGFFNDLLRIFMNTDGSRSRDIIRKLSRSARNGEPEEMLSCLKSFLADIPYDLSKNKPEIYFENNIYIIFNLLGYYITSEYRTSNGRIDLLLKTDRYIYLLELKLNGNAKDAIDQIYNKEYFLPFQTDNRKIFKIGINFSKETRNIDSWIIE